MYTQSITRNHRTAFILAIDCSGSMAESILFRGRRLTKAEAVAGITNDLLFELVERARRSDGIRDYYDIAVIGYSGDDEVRSLLPDGEELVPVSALAAREMPVRTEVIEHRLPDGSIALREIPAPSWIEPQAAGQTPMCEALRRVRDIAAEWTARAANAESFPPVVFNITDGEATDCDDEELRAVCNQLKALETADGNVLLINIHIAAGDAGRHVFFPEAHEANYTNRYAALLYDCSSEMPAVFNEAIREAKGPGAVPPVPGHELQRIGGPAGHHAQHRFHQRQNRIAMTATIQHFTRALLTPDLSLATLSDARAVTDRNGMPRMVRTTRFAEAEIEWRGERWLAAMPLTPAALPRIERTASVLGRMNTEHLTQFRILPEEMRWTDALGNERRTGLVLQQLPGREFAEALLTEDKTVLLAALDTLREALRELEFTHNNLRESNLRWHRGRIIPIRYYDARIGAAENGGADAEAFEALKRRIAEAPMPRQSVNDVEAVYNPVRKLTGHRWTSHVFEGLVCVEDEGGFGFVDTDNNPVIPSQFLWAGDFHEGRAEVQTRTGMGLIDREGGYVIPPEYEIVDYDPAVSIVHVRHGGRWALFDYLGRRLTEFGREDMQEPVRQEPCRSEICR